jgi:hypothetical protein
LDLQRRFLRINRQFGNQTVNHLPQPAVTHKIRNVACCMSLGSVFKVFTLFFMGALFSVRRRTGKNSVLLHFADKPA